MDGTIYIDDRLFDGVKEFLSYVRELGGRCVFLTNNSSRGSDAYVEKLARLGIESCPDDFFSSADAAAEYIKKHHSERSFFVCGTESLKKQLKAEGIKIAEDAGPETDAVLLAYDTELNYKKLENCCILLGRGCLYIATHPDMLCPTYYGSAPDCGCIIEMLKTASGREPVIIGKPQPQMVYSVMEKFGFSREQSCLVGDRLYTDIACGVNAGIDTVFVLSGEGRIDDIAKYGIEPSFVLKDINELLEVLRRG